MENEKEAGKRGKGKDDLKSRWWTKRRDTKEGGGEKMREESKNLQTRGKVGATVQATV